MIAAIPAEDRPTIVRQTIPTHLEQAVKTFRIEAVHHFSNVLPNRFSVLARAIRNHGPLTCISCGAKTDASGNLPCGH